MRLERVLYYPLQKAITSVFFASVGGGVAAFTPSAVASIHSWYDPSDLASLFQLSGGTGVVAANDPVGYMADKSGGGFHMLQATGAARPILRGTPTGAELVTNGDFASGTGWTTGAGWSIGAGVATATAATGSLDQAGLAGVASTIYQITYTITRTVGTVQPQIGGVTGATRSATGTYIEWITASGTGQFQFNTSTFTGTVDDVSVKVASAGSVAAPYWLEFDYVDDFMATAALSDKVLPIYMMLAARFMVGSDYRYAMEFGQNTSNLLGIGKYDPVSPQHFYSSKHSVAGNVDLIGTGTQVPLNTDRLIEGMSIVGTNKVQVDNGTQQTLANAWTGGTTLTAPKIGISNSITSWSPTKRFYGAAVVLAEPSAGERASLRTYFAAKQGRVL